MCMGRGRIPASPYSGVLSLFMTAILCRQAPTIFGDGEQSRDFTFVEDVVALNIKAAEAPASISGRMYNGGNGGRITLNQAWALLRENRRRSDSRRSMDPPRAGDVRDSQADTTRWRAAILGTIRNLRLNRECARLCSGTGKAWCASLIGLAPKSRQLKRLPGN